MTGSWRRDGVGPTTLSSRFGSVLSRTAFIMCTVSRVRQVYPVIKQPMSPSNRALSSLKDLASLLRTFLVEVEPCSESVGVGATDERSLGRSSVVIPGVKGNFESPCGREIHSLLIALDMMTSARSGRGREEAGGGLGLRYKQVANKCVAQ